MQRFKSVAQAQRFLSIHDAVGNLFSLGRHLLRAAIIGSCVIVPS
jgi:putative transposase